MATRSRPPRGRLRPPEADADERLDPTTCPDCGGRPRQDGIDRVCPDCGLVVDTDAVDHGREWRSYDHRFDRRGDDPRRCGPPRDRTRHDRGLGTTIGHDDADRRLPYRVRRWHVRTRLGKKPDRSRAYVYGECRRLADRLDQPDLLVETAGELIEAAQAAGLTVGRSLDGLAAAAFAAAARLHDAPVTRVDVLEYGRTDRPTLASCYDALNRELDIPIPPPDPAVLVDRVGEAVDLRAKKRTDAAAIVERTDDRAVTGRNPWSVAAAAVYLAAGGSRNALGVTQADVGEAAGVSAKTVQKVAAVMEGADG